MIERAVFDFDGTLVDTFSQNIKLIKQIRPDLGNREIDIFRRLGARKACKELGVGWMEIVRVAEIVRREHRKIIEEAHFFEGMGELLLELRNKGMETGILSSNSSENIKKCLHKNQTDVDWVRTETNLFGKDKAINKIKGINMMYACDEVRDVEACKKEGVKVVAVTWGYNDKESLVAAKPDYVVETPLELRNLFLSFSQ
jgi:phosphoglycolate phosphatase